MIIYKNSSEGFMRDVNTNRITDRIKEAFYENTGKTRFHHKEDLSWNNSLMYMEKALRRSGIPGDCGVLIEYKLPSTSKRIDFIVSGQDAAGNRKFIIIELKQWAEAESTTARDLVKTPYYGDFVTHPSYQVSSYKGFLMDFNENVYTNKLTPYACAYLHNYTRKDPEPLTAPVYSESIAEAPIYFKDDYEMLEAFIREHVGRGNGMEIMYEIESGNIRPSKQLVDHVVGLFNGNKEFHLIDEQKVTYERALERGLNAEKKTVILVNGGPGTGKSVVSMSLLGGFLKKRENVFFVAPNAAGVSIFFIDDDQVIRPEDIGAVSEVRRVAERHNAEIIELGLSTQFRCPGAEGYVNWVNDVLDIRDTGNFDGWDKEGFEFRIAGSPDEVRDWIYERASQGYRARILAGYAWKWTSVQFRLFVKRA